MHTVSRGSYWYQSQVYWSADWMFTLHMLRSSPLSFNMCRRQPLQPWSLLRRGLFLSRCQCDAQRHVHIVTPMHARQRHLFGLWCVWPRLQAVLLLPGGYTVHAAVFLHSFHVHQGEFQAETTECVCDEPCRNATDACAAVMQDDVCGICGGDGLSCLSGCDNMPFSNKVWTNFIGTINLHVDSRSLRGLWGYSLQWYRFWWLCQPMWLRTIGPDNVCPPPPHLFTIKMGEGQLWDMWRNTDLLLQRIWPV